MKFFSLLVVFLFLNINAQNINAQIYRFKTSSVSVIEKAPGGNWGKWSPFKKAEMIITLDGKKNRVVVNSRELQLYKIVSYGEVIENLYDKTVPLECVDNDGGSCTILIVTRKNQNNRMQFYINYNDVKMVYNIFNDN